MRMVTNIVIFSLPFQHYRILLQMDDYRHDDILADQDGKIHGYRSHRRAELEVTGLRLYEVKEFCVRFFIKSNRMYLLNWGLPSFRFHNRSCSIHHIYFYKNLHFYVLVVTHTFSFWKIFNVNISYKTRYNSLNLNFFNISPNFFYSHP